MIFLNHLPVITVLYMKNLNLSYHKISLFYLLERITDANILKCG